MLLCARLPKERFLLELLMVLFLRYAARDAEELERLYMSACVTWRRGTLIIAYMARVGAFYGTGC